MHEALSVCRLTYEERRKANINMEKIISQLGEKVQEQLPAASSFLLKGVICIAVYIIGKKLIAAAVKMVRKLLVRECRRAR